MERKIRNWRTGFAKWLVALLPTAALVSLAAAEAPRLTGIDVQGAPAAVTVRGTGVAGTAYQLAQDAFGLSDLTAEGVDLVEAARTYLLESGLGGDEIAAVLEKLAAGGR